jgi:CPA2 family monovalent cation:H+ antiporter-2
VIHYLQEHHPNIEICVRIHDHEHARHLIGTGVHLAIPETVESGLQLASMTLQALGFSPVYIEKILGVVHRSSSKASS